MRGSAGPNRWRNRSSAARNSGSASAPRPDWYRRLARSSVKSRVNVAVRSLRLAVALERLAEQRLGLGRLGRCQLVGPLVEAGECFERVGLDVGIGRREGSGSCGGTEGFDPAGASRGRTAAVPLGFDPVGWEIASPFTKHIDFLQSASHAFCSSAGSSLRVGIADARQVCVLLPVIEGLDDDGRGRGSRDWSSLVQVASSAFSQSRAWPRSVALAASSGGGSSLPCAEPARAAAHAAS